MTNEGVQIFTASGKKKQCLISLPAVENCVFGVKERGKERWKLSLMGNLSSDEYVQRCELE